MEEWARRLQNCYASCRSLRPDARSIQAPGVWARRQLSTSGQGSDEGVTGLTQWPATMVGGYSVRAVLA
jgi:hypothetical protein